MCVSAAAHSLCYPKFPRLLSGTTRSPRVYPDVAWHLGRLGYSFGGMAWPVIPIPQLPAMTLALCRAASCRAVKLPTLLGSMAHSPPSPTLCDSALLGLQRTHVRRPWGEVHAIPNSPGCSVARLRVPGKLVAAPCLAELHKLVASKRCLN